MMEQFLKLPPAQKAAVLAALLAVIGVGGYFLVVDPVQTEASVAERNLKAARTELDALAAVAKDEELVRLRTRKDELAEADKERRKLLPASEEVPDLIDSVQRDAVANGLVVQRMERAELKHMNLVDAVPVRMTVQGSLIDFIRFLRTYASSERRIIHLRALTLENVPPDGGEILKELQASLPVGQREARARVSPEEQRLEQIQVADLARKKLTVRATFIAMAYIWTGKPPPEGDQGGANAEKRKRT